MRSTVYMNHYPHFSSGAGREAVTADLTASVAGLASRSQPLGCAADMTFQALQLDRMKAPSPSDMLVIGSQELIDRNLKRLRISIGRIAREANEVGTQHGHYYQPQLADCIDDIAQHVLPSALEQNEFIGSVGGILRGFGEYCNDDGCEVDFGRRVGWYHTATSLVESYNEVPTDIRQELAIPLLQPEVPRKEVSRDLWILRVLADHWIIDHADSLKGESGLTPELRQEYEEYCALNVEAIQKMNDYVQTQTGRPMSALHIPVDEQQKMIETERNNIKYWRQQKDWTDTYVTPYNNTMMGRGTPSGLQAASESTN